MRQVAFLRGMNVGGHRVTNAELVDVFLGVGLADPVPYQASGNVVFAACDEEDEGPANAIGEFVERALEDALGYPVPTFLRSGAALRDISSRQPFEGIESAGKPQAMLLRQAPGPDGTAAVAAMATDDDRLVVAGTELHWLPGRGVGKSQLDMRALEALSAPPPCAPSAPSNAWCRSSSDQTRRDPAALSNAGPLKERKVWDSNPW